MGLYHQFQTAITFAKLIPSLKYTYVSLKWPFKTPANKNLMKTILFKRNQRFIILCILLRMFKIRRINICIIHCVLCLQLLLLSFPEIVSMSTFLNNQINIFCCKLLNVILCIDDNFYFLCIFITCDEQTFHYSNKVWFILKNATQIYFLLSFHLPQSLMNLHIKDNTHVHQDLQKSF